ncbi:hypothetical protein Tco_0760461 [Tanacetum coccineum]
MLGSFQPGARRKPSALESSRKLEKQNFERKANFRNHQRSERRRDKFTLLTESPKEILAIDKGKFKTPPPMTTPVGKRNNNKFYEFHRGKDQPKSPKKGETFKKDKPLEILMVQPWQRVAPSGSKKLNGSSYRTPYWLQWINHMANGTNIAAGKNKGYGAFHINMDEFCGCKITISVQWDHRKTGSEEDSSSPVNSSRNVKIPGSRRNNYSTE